MLGRLIGILTFSRRTDCLTGPAKVIDGDTIVVAGERVRLHGIDAPELDQTFWWRGQQMVCGTMSLAALEALIAGVKVRCEVVERDRHGRVVAKVYSPDTVDTWPRDAEAFGDDPCPLAEECVVSAIEKHLAVLSSSSASEQEKLEALRYLGHWVGDVHQPLHLSFEDNRGANNIGVSGGLCSWDLHAVWDGCIIEQGVPGDAYTVARDLLDGVTPNFGHGSFVFTPFEELFFFELRGLYGCMPSIFFGLRPRLLRCSRCHTTPPLVFFSKRSAFILRAIVDRCAVRR